MKKIDFKTYSAQATEAAYLLIRDNQATAAVYDYVDVLKSAVKENKIEEAKDYFFTGLYLKENGISLSDVDGTDMLKQVAALEHTRYGKSWISYKHDKFYGLCIAYIRLGTEGRSEANS